MAKSSLGEYSAKRTFTATPEPGPEVAERSSGPLLFVVQMHAATRLHYDFRLECDGVLKSWAVPKGPSLDPADKRMAMVTEDHPYDYASFEGVIPPKQYGAGEVIVWDCGVYSPDEGGTAFHDRAQAQRRVREGLASGKLSIQLRGEKLKGSFALVRMKDPKSWLLLKHKDRFAGAVDVTQHDRSVLSGALLEDLKAVPAHRIAASQLVPAGGIAAMPARLSPMLAEPGDAPFNDPEWSWEPKLDGYRVLAFVDGDRVRLQSRRGLDLTGVFPALTAELARQDVRGMVLDGEIIAFDAGGKPSFNALQNRVQLKAERDIAAADRNVPAVFFAFDLIHFAGIDLRNAAYRDRRRHLAQCLLPSPLVQLVHASDDGVALHDAAIAGGFEGVVGKRKDSRYEAGRRSAAWLKVKPTQSAEFVIGGYTKGKGARAPFGAILVGHWAGGKLQFASHVGSGFDDRTLAAVQAALQPLKRATCPFAEEPELPNPTTWVEPRLVAEVKFHEWTGDGRLRAPVFLRLRDDVDAKKVKGVRSAKKGASPRAASPRAASPRAASSGAASSRAASSPRKRGSGSESGDSLDSRLRGNDEAREKRRNDRGRAKRGNDAARQDEAREKPGADDVAQIVAQLDHEKRNTFPLAVGPHRIRLTHLDRVYWPADPALQQPALTKRDLLRYFAQVSPYILPHLADRPLTMIRMPSGIRGERFFQKHWEQERPDFVDTITVFSGSRNESGEYLLCSNLPTLLWLAQSGTLEFHIWHSRAKVGADAVSKGTDYASSEESLQESVLNYPDYVVFDIDPYIYSGKEAKGEEPELNNIAFEKGKEVAFWLRELLQGMGLEPIVKTSGKTGLHVFVPIHRTLDFDAARHVSELVGRHLMRLHPKDITMEWSIPKRTGKIFMDYNMNVRGKTLNVAYSPRGAPGAPVSMPLTWDELAGAHPLDFRLTNAPQRLARTGDRWRDALRAKQDLQQALAGAG